MGHYTKPEIKEYGTLTELTASCEQSGSGDVFNKLAPTAPLLTTTIPGALASACSSGRLT
jgi:hypothetical protein